MFITLIYLTLVRIFIIKSARVLPQLLLIDYNECYQTTVQIL